MSTGNEFSFYMLLSSNFILNRVSSIGEFSIYPFIHSFSNIRDSQQQLLPIQIPDVLPSNLPPTADFSMVAGDFIEVYGDNPNNEGKEVYAPMVRQVRCIVFLMRGPHRRLGCGGHMLLYRHGQKHYPISRNHSQDLETWRYVDQHWPTSLPF